MLKLKEKYNMYIICVFIWMKIAFAFQLIYLVSEMYTPSVCVSLNLTINTETKWNFWYYSVRTLQTLSLNVNVTH